MADPISLARLDRVEELVGEYVADFLAESEFLQAAAFPSGGDDTTMFTALEAALPSTGGVIRLRAGAYSLPSGYSFSKRVHLEGEGLGDPYAYAPSSFPSSTLSRGMSTILVSSATAHGITFTIDGSSMSNLAVVNTSGSAPSAGSGVRSTSSNLFRMNNSAVVGFYDNVDINNGGLWAIRGSYISNPVRYGVRIRNDDVQDEGDGFIGDGTAIYTTSRNATAGINWESGGGLKCSGLKINGNVGIFTSGIKLNPSTTSATVICLITGCSIENCTVQVDLNRQGASGTIRGVNIVGNEFGGGTYGVLLQSAGFTEVNIADNVFTSVQRPILINYGTGVRIGPNSYYGWSSTYGTVGYAATVTSLRIDQQHTWDNGIVVGMIAPFTDCDVVADYRHRKALGVITSSATTLYRLGMHVSNAGTIDFSVSGSATNVGAFTVRGTRSFTRGSSGAVTVATIGSDTQVGAASTDVVVTFDTAAVSGEVQVKLALSSGSATDLNGTFEIDVKGPLQFFRIGA